MRVLAPGVRPAALADDRAEPRVGQHVHPRRRRRRVGRRDDDVFAAVLRETAGAVERDQVAALALPRRPAPPPGGCATGANARHGHLGPARRSTCSANVPAVSLTITRATVCISTLSSSDICSMRRTKIPPGRSSRFASARRRDHAHDLVLQHLPVSRLVLVPDDQVDREPLHAPVRVRLHELADELHLRPTSPMRSSTIGRSPEMP